MKKIAIASVTAGGKTTAVNLVQNILKNAKSLHFDDYNFEGAVDDYYKWVKDGANYNVWNLEPLLQDIINIEENEHCDYLLLDYPFAYCHDLIKNHIDLAIFIDTPLDIALARGILRDMQNSSADEIRDCLKNYLEKERLAYLQMAKDIRPSSDVVINGTLDKEKIAIEIVKCIERFH